MTRAVRTLSGLAIQSARTRRRPEVLFSGPGLNSVGATLVHSAGGTGAGDLFVGVNAVDYSGYPDCRPEYIEAFERMANLATKAGVEGTQRLTIHAPLMQLTKEGIIRRGLELGVDYAATLSCYDPDAQGRACGACDACRLRLRGFAAAGVPDPAAYQPDAVAR